MTILKEIADVYSIKKELTTQHYIKKLDKKESDNIALLKSTCPILK